MSKSELITALFHQSHLGHRDVELAVGTLLDHMSQTLAQGERIEIRGFAGFRFKLDIFDLSEEQ